MGWIERFCERARPLSRRIVLPEGGDEAVVRGAARLAGEGIAQPVLLGRRQEVAALAGGESLDGVEIVDPVDPEVLAAFATAYASRRDGVSHGMALRLVRRPLFFGAMMVAEDQADAMVAGANHSTTRVIVAASLAVGFAEGVSRASSFFVMVLPGPPERVLVYADAAVVVEPDAEELARIAVLTARNATALLEIEPHVAFLSYSSHGSASHERVDKVRAAVEGARQLAPDLAIDGELQADAALSPRVAAKKCPDSPLAGNANVLVFPDLDAGNIAYKLTQYLAGAQAIGPILQGLRKPVNDLSRGASADDVVGVCAIAALQTIV